LLIQYQSFLSDVDVIAAKAKCQPINGIMPQITNTDCILEMPTTYFVFEQQTEKEITHPQTIEQQENRIV
jgi:DNA mismatch repair protein MutS2